MLLSGDLILIKLNWMQFDVVWCDADNVPRLDFLEWVDEGDAHYQKSSLKGNKKQILRVTTALFNDSFALFSFPFVNVIQFNQVGTCRVFTSHKSYVTSSRWPSTWPRPSARSVLWHLQIVLYNILFSSVVKQWHGFIGCSVLKLDESFKKIYVWGGLLRDFPAWQSKCAVLFSPGFI